MSEEECICQGKCPGVMPEKSIKEPPEDDFSLEDVPELVLKKILEKIPRRKGFHFNGQDSGLRNIRSDHA